MSNTNNPNFNSTSYDPRYAYTYPTQSSQRPAEDTWSGAQSSSMPPNTQYPPGGPDGRSSLDARPGSFDGAEPGDACRQGWPLQINGDDATRQRTEDYLNQQANTYGIRDQYGANPKGTKRAHKDEIRHTIQGQGVDSGSGARKKHTDKRRRHHHGSESHGHVKKNNV